MQQHFPKKVARTVQISSFEFWWKSKQQRSNKIELFRDHNKATTLAHGCKFELVSKLFGRKGIGSLWFFGKRSFVATYWEKHLDLETHGRDSMVRLLKIGDRNYSMLWMDKKEKKNSSMMLLLFSLVKGDSRTVHSFHWCLNESIRIIRTLSQNLAALSNFYFQTSNFLCCNRMLALL